MSSSQQNHLGGLQMHAKPLSWLALAALAVAVLAALPIRQPGTMDSHYYYGGGRSLREHRAFVEPYVWNYLDYPEPLPNGATAGLLVPSHLYWMPLPSILVALAQAALGTSFRAAQLPFILMTAALPLVSYLTSWQLSRNRRHAVVAGALTIFSGFYLPYCSLPETFAPFALLGGLSLACMGLYAESRRDGWALAAGLLSGLCHLCRADGILLLVTGALTVSWLGTRAQSTLSQRTRAGAARPLLLLFLGYLATMAPWFVRNWLVIGSPLSAAVTKTLFLRDYDELFSYGTPLTWARYQEWGWANILGSKLAAGWVNLQTFVAVNNLVFLAPLFLAGLWQTRRRLLLRPAVIFAPALYTAMTVLYTFPGARGGVFHSSAALLPAIFSASVLGLDGWVDWVARRRRRWDRRSARLVFDCGAVLLAAALSLIIYQRRVVGKGTWSDPAWNRADAVMAEVGDWLAAHESGSPVVMVGNPPAFAFHTGLSAIVVPNEGVERTLQAARRYGAGYLLLDQNRPAPLAPLYQGEEAAPQLAPIWRQGSAVLYRILVVQP